MSNVSILPQGAIVNNVTNVKEKRFSAKTYEIKDNRVVGFCEGIDALKQTIYFILNTERYDYLIYSNNYGSELRGTIGLDKDIGESELKRRIAEALIDDDRINSVDDFEFKYEKDSVLIKFTVFSIYGNLELKKELI